MIDPDSTKLQLELQIREVGEIVLGLVAAEAANHRAECRTRGFSTEAAEAMAVFFHNEIITHIFDQQPPKQ